MLVPLANLAGAERKVLSVSALPGIDVDELSKRWIAHAVGPRPKIVAALDWTDFDADNQATIMLSLVTNHGRSTPLVCLTVTRQH